MHNNSCATLHKMRIRLFLFFIVFLFFLTSCSVTKFVPENNYLLDNVEIRSDNKNINKEEFKKYVHQQPNTKVFGFWRMQLRIYSTAGRDTSRWHNRVFMRAGEAPVIYDKNQTYLSERSLERALQNKGYMHAEVSSLTMFSNKKKAKVVYYIDENEPYSLGDYEVEVPDARLEGVASDSTNSLVKKGMLFDVDVLDAERDRVTKTLRQEGYYRFNKELLHYEADSALNTKRVDVKMTLRDFDENLADSIEDVIFTRYVIRNVAYMTSRNLSTVGSLATAARDSFEIDQYGNYYLIYDEDDKFLKMNLLLDNTFIEPHTYYNDAAVEKTYNSLNVLSPVKYVNISFKEVEGDSLDCLISIAPSKLFSLNADLEGTRTGEFWGVAAGLGVTQRNVFKGAESLSLQGRLAYEWQKGAIAREWGLQADLLFPKFMMPFTTTELRRRMRANTQFTVNMNHQNRPKEFTVSNAGIAMKYNWIHTKYRHTLELIDLSFVDFTVDSTFWNDYIETGRFNKYSYEDHLIMQIGYSGSFSTYNSAQPMKNYFSMRYGIETAGNLLYGINSLFGGVKDADGLYTIFKVPYSQYVRADYNVSFHHIIDQNNRFVYHFGLGVGLPYGNADIIPYLRRYYSGGANSVRGWSEGTLGPGSYQRVEEFRNRRDYNQVGDIKLDINAEYRYKMFRSLDGAVFIDAGNIWTVKPYETQKNGEFRFDTFYKQIALAYGLGLRLDLSFVVIRLDLGVRLYDPALSENRWRLKWTSNDFALHFAVGYPF